MKRAFYYIAIAIISIAAVQCGSNTQTGTESVGKDSNASKSKTDTVVVFVGINSKGIGRFNNVELKHPLDAAMASRGKTVYESKCFACHKLTTEKLVGPGWSGVTQRRQPEWIMNWITNTKVMLDKDLAAQTEMVVCLIRMPNQDLTDAQARDVLEFMRQNDGEK